MVYIDSLDKYKKIKDFAILINDKEVKFVIKKFKQPILIKLNELSKFMKEFLIKDEVINWVIDNISYLNKKPEILRLLIQEISKTDVISYGLSDGSTKYEINGPKHKIDIYQDEIGSLIQIKDKKNRLITRISLGDKKIITTTVRGENDNTELVILYPKIRKKSLITLKEIANKD